jgi:F0F1-type ATP synthase epsilon subunit
VLDGAVTVLAEAAETPESLDPAAAQKDLEAARADVPPTEAAFAERDRRLVRARARLRLAKPR